MTTPSGRRRLRQPHILAEIIRCARLLSSENQKDFLDVLDFVGGDLRELLRAAGRLACCRIDHRTAWPRFRGRRIAFIDGGVANIDSPGSEPLAIRVGSYTVTPGNTGPTREAFDFEVQLVDELYETPDHSEGIFEDVFEDVSKLRDAARMCCEVAGVLRVLQRDPPPDLVFLHGPLVNPVSPYALGVPGTQGAFPNFRRGALAIFLPGESVGRAGPEANFVVVYRDQLRRIAGGRTPVCGVVERVSRTAPGPMMLALTEALRKDGHLDRDATMKLLKLARRYGLSDSLIMESVLEEGEYCSPIPMDKQGPDSKIPAIWADYIHGYPKPLVSYVKPSVNAMPLRVELLGGADVDVEGIMSLLVHMSRLVPRYAFPVGLDIVDKHSKIPAWMAGGVTAMLQAQLMRRALETRNPQVIRLVRRVLATGGREWLFRPDFRRS